MSSKDEHAAAFTTERAGAAKQEYILKGSKANTYSAILPAYAFTSLCPEPSLRVAKYFPELRRKKVQYEVFI